jgi:hypothetical protein
VFFYSPMSGPKISRTIAPLRVFCLWHTVFTALTQAGGDTKPHQNTWRMNNNCFFLLFWVSVLTGACGLTSPQQHSTIIQKKTEISDSIISGNNCFTLLLEGNKENKVYIYKGETPADTSAIIVSYKPPRNELKQFISGQISDTIPGDSLKKLPVFIVKWGEDATYGEVIDVIDILKLHNAKYGLTKISQQEYIILKKKTGVAYKEMLPPEPKKQ